MVRRQVNQFPNLVMVKQTDYHRTQANVMGGEAEILGGQAQVMHKPVAELGGVLIIIVTGLF